MTLIADNFVSGVGDSAEFLGILTFSQLEENVALDVTDFVSANLGDELGFLIAREVRFDGENVDRSLGAVRFDSTNNSSGLGPRLTLEIRAVPEPTSVAFLSVVVGIAVVRRRRRSH